MSATHPILTRSRNGYTLRWDNLVMEVRQLRRKDEDWRCELLIGLESGDDVDLIWTGHHNLMAARTRSLLAKDLQERIDYLPWAEMLQQLSFILVQEERQGEPSINMANYPEPEGLNYLMRGWVLEGKPTALFGLGGSGKTWLGLTICQCLAAGVNLLGYAIPQGIPVQVYDYENDPDLTRLRLAKIAAGLGIPVAQIHYRQLSYAITDYEELIAREIDEHGIKFAMLDSFALASGGSQQKDELVIPVYALLRRLGIATLLIDHEAKASNGEYAIGTVYKHNLARITWQLKATRENTETGDLYLLASNRKNNEDKRQKPIGIHMMFGPRAVLAKRIDAADLPSDLTSDLPLRQRILASLQEHRAMSTTELAELLGENAKEVGTRLKEMDKEKLVHQITRGGGRGNPSTWELHSDREPEPPEGFE